MTKRCRALALRDKENRHVPQTAHSVLTWAAEGHGPYALDARAELRRRHVLDVVSRAIGTLHPMARPCFEQGHDYASAALTLDGGPV